MAVTQRPVTQEALRSRPASPLWKQLPSWFVFGEEDRNIPAALEHYMAERAGAHRTIEIPGASHAVSVAHPAADGARHPRGRGGARGRLSWFGAAAGGQATTACPASGSAPRSSLRELMSSFANTLRRWYSTVRGLMNSWAPISGFVCPSRGEAGDLRLLRREDVARLVGAPAHRLAGGQQLAAGALGERLGPEAAEHLVGGAQLLARVDAPVLAPQPFAVEQVGAGELDADPGALEPLDRLAVERVGLLALAHQRP